MGPHSVMENGRKRYSSPNDTSFQQDGLMPLGPNNLCGGEDWHHFSLFAGLSAVYLQKLSVHLRPVNYACGRFLFHMREPAHTLHILRRGVVQLSTLSTDGTEHVLDLVRPHDVFGGLSFGRRSHHVTAARALSDVSTYVVDRTAFMEFVQSSPTLAFNTLQHCVAQRRRAAVRATALKHPEAGPRLVYVILDLGRRYDRRDDGGYRLPRAVTQTVLAELASLNRCTASRLINEYRRSGVFGGGGRTLIVYPGPAEVVLARGGLEPIDRVPDSV